MKTLYLVLIAITAAIAGIAYVLLGMLIFAMVSRGHGYSIGAVVEGLWVPVGFAMSATYGFGICWARWLHLKRRPDQAVIDRIYNDFGTGAQKQAWREQRWNFYDRE